MRIIKVADDIFKFAPEHCEGIALSLPPNAFQWYWNNEFVPSYTRAGCYPYRRENGVWQAVPGMDLGGEQGYLYRLAPPLGKLEFVYLHPNPPDQPGVNPGEIAGMVAGSLTQLNAMGCRSVAMNGIPGLGQANAENTAQIVGAIQNWCEANVDGHIRQVYLVDLDGGFGQAGEENRRIVIGPPPAPGIEGWAECKGLPDWIRRQLQRPGAPPLSQLFSEYVLGYRSNHQAQYQDGTVSEFFRRGLEDRAHDREFGTSLREVIELNQWVEPWLDRIQGDLE